MGIYEWMRADTERSARALRTKEVCREEVDEELAPKRHKPSLRSMEFRFVSSSTDFVSPGVFEPEPYLRGPIRGSRVRNSQKAQTLKSWGE